MFEIYCVIHNILHNNYTDPDGDDKNVDWEIHQLKQDNVRHVNSCLISYCHVTSFEKCKFVLEASYKLNTYRMNA